MSRQTLYFLQNCLRFDDTSTPDPRKKVDNLDVIEEIVDNFVENVQKSSEKNFTVDKMP